MDFPVIAVIMAGGRGERFWPFSRRTNPKQFLEVFGEKNLLRKTYERISSVSFVNNIYISAGEDMEEMVRETLPEVSSEELLLEPVGRNTAPCVAYSAYRIRECYGDKSIIITLPSDHHITSDDAFSTSIEKAVKTASDGRYLVTFGIVPTHPETGYGYIQVSKPIDESEGIYEVERFIEKPDLSTAEEYLSKKDKYYWNSGIFIWRTDRIIQSIEDNMKELTEKIEPLLPHLCKDDERDVLREVFPTLPSISVDYGVMERDERIALVKAEFDWNDLGCWDAVEGIFDKDENDNISVGNNIEVSSKNNIVVSENSNIAVYGVEDLIVVSTGDAVLVLPKGESQRVREIIKAMKEGPDWTKEML